MQCKDIPDRPILAFLADMPRWPQNGLRMWGNWGSREDNANTVLHAMPLGTPEKLALAKIRQMIRRGVVEGCGCGCRGDFQITDKGQLELDHRQASGLNSFEGLSGLG